MSLRLSDFSNYLLAGSQVSYQEVRSNEAYAASVFVRNEAGVPVDISGWTFTVAYENFLATLSTTGGTAGATSGLLSVTNIMQLSVTPIVDPNLAIILLNPTSGSATLTIPTTVTGSGPAGNVTPDSNQNVLVKLILITARFPDSQLTTFNNIRILPAALIIRFGG